jgi:hypothetical protein
MRFDSGGWLPPGLTLAQNDTGQPERVYAPKERMRLDDYTIDAIGRAAARAAGGASYAQGRGAALASRTGG